MRRVSTTFALALCLLGCSLAPGEPVALLTGVNPDYCYAGGEQGVTALLIVDPTHGTSFDGRPVMWPVGFTGRRVGAEVEVLDAQGNVKATTGRTYHISYAPAPDSAQAINAFPAAVELRLRVGLRRLHRRPRQRILP